MTIVELAFMDITNIPELPETRAHIQRRVMGEREIVIIVASLFTAVAAVTAELGVGLVQREVTEIQTQISTQSPALVVLVEAQ